MFVKIYLFTLNIHLERHRRKTNFCEAQGKLRGKDKVVKVEEAVLQLKPSKFMH